MAKDEGNKSNLKKKTGNDTFVQISSKDFVKLVRSLSKIGEMYGAVDSSSVCIRNKLTGRHL